jgi:hypothetical protein
MAIAVKIIAVRGLGGRQIIVLMIETSKKYTGYFRPLSRFAARKNWLRAVAGAMIGLYRYFSGAIENFQMGIFGVVAISKWEKEKRIEF